MIGKNLNIVSMRSGKWKAQMNVQPLDQPTKAWLFSFCTKPLLLYISCTILPHYDTHKMALLIHLGAHHRHRKLHKESKDWSRNFSRDLSEISVPGPWHTVANVIKPNLHQLNMCTSHKYLQNIKHFLFWNILAKTFRPINPIFF